MPNNRIQYGSSVWNFVRMEGHPDLPGQHLISVEKDGVDGVAFVESEFRADPTPIYLMGIAVNDYDKLLFIANMKNLQGTQVSLYTADGTAYHGVVITASKLISCKFQLVCQWLGVTFLNSYKLTWQLTVRYPYGSF
jgi:hypothetical protein